MFAFRLFNAMGLGGYSFFVVAFKEPENTIFK